MDAERNDQAGIPGDDRSGQERPEFAPRATVSRKLDVALSVNNLYCPSPGDRKQLGTFIFVGLNEIAWGLEPDVRVICFPVTSFLSILPDLHGVTDYCVEKIRALQPTGPYRLGGYCFGGVMAFEIARKLVESGQQVDFLALVETPYPWHSRPLRDPAACPRVVSTDRVRQVTIPPALGEGPSPTGSARACGV